MGHDHDHAGGLSAGAKHRRPLAIALGLTTLYLVVEVVVGVAVGSLALISDAGHMLTDTAGLAMALAAITFAQRGRDDRRTYGRYRLEALASLANAVLLFAVAVYVIIEAVGRFRDPVDVPGAGLILVAAVGLIVNVVSFLLLRRGAGESLNVRGAFLEVFADMIGSAGVIIAGVILVVTGWPYADPIVGMGIGLFVLPRAWRLGRDAVHILLEGVPDGITLAEVRAALAELPHVTEVHDLHVWTLTSGINLATAHLRLTPDADHADVLRVAGSVLHDRFDLEHTTLQLEPHTYAEPELDL